jgi:hypothetical protein
MGKQDVTADALSFSDEAWRTVPYFRIMGQSYRLLEMWAGCTSP